MNVKVKENNKENILKIYKEVKDWFVRNPISFILLGLLVWKIIMIYLVSALAYYLEAPLATSCVSGWDSDLVFSSTVDPLWNFFGTRWDCFHYLRIAYEGYGGHESTYAFSPLFPGLIRLFSLNGTLDLVFIAVFIANFFSFVAVIIFYYICQLYNLNLKQSLTATLLFAFFPQFLVYTTIAYSESIYLTLSLLAWYFFEKARQTHQDKNQKTLLLCVGSLLAGLAFLARYPGILLFGIFPAVIMIDFLLKKDFKKESVLQLIISMISSLIGVFVPFIWFSHLINRGIDLSAIQLRHWGQEIALFKGALGFLSIPATFFEFYSLVFFLLFLCLIAGFKKHWSLLIQSLPFFIFYSSVTGIGAWAVVRYCSTIWPAYIGWGSINKELLASLSLILFFMMWSGFYFIRFCFCSFWG
ncbi:MAG: hypothetical protein ACFFC7_18925 [Candidatus Hermodarchaeota archaeon]